MVAAETTLVVTIAATLGTAVALVAVAAIAWALTHDIGVAIPTTMDWPVLSLVVLACLLLALFDQRGFGSAGPPR